MPATPNILFIHVDEMRFPMHFPPGITTPDEFLAKFMPNLYSMVWKKGVKFTNYYTAAADCTPGRGTFVTGLYAYQTNLFLTRENSSNAYATSQPQPPLQPGFETYGKILRNLAAKFETPYIGKWHLSDSPATPESSGASTYLDNYGFKGLTMPDPLGMPAQGIGLTKPQYQGAPPPPGDPEIAEQAVRWLYNRRNNPNPFCLTVGFVNPHDKQFFWGGTQASQFNAVYNTIPDSLSPTGFEMPAFTFNPVVGPPPPPVTYNGVPVNWETTQHLKANKPELQTVFKEMFSYYWTGGIAEDSANRYFYPAVSDYAKPKHNAVAPYEYWARALDFYTQMMTAVDVQIGQVIHNIPPELAGNTVIVFCADHGEYASSHGLQGKGGSVYRECFNVPLMVYDPQPNRYTREPDTKREQLVSSVDLLRMLVTLGNGGNESWLIGPYAEMWGGDLRANLYGMLQSPATAGRQYVVYSTDEFFSVTTDYLHAPQHVIGLLTSAGVANPNAGKLGFYHHWIEDTTDWNPAKKTELEYYNYATNDGLIEKESTPTSTQASNAKTYLLNTAIPVQLKRPLPKQYEESQKEALRQYWQFVRRADVQSVSTAFA
jgi:arylsulfatase A-like enzyme